MADAAYKTVTGALAAVTVVSGAWLAATMANGFYYYATVGKNGAGGGTATPKRKEGQDVVVVTQATKAKAQDPAKAQEGGKAWWKVW